MTERPHRVEEVGDGCDAAIERASGLVGGRVGVAARHDDAAARQQVDQLERAVQLRRERHRGHGACVEQAREQRRIWVAARVDGVRPEPHRREEGPFEVDADHARADGLPRDLGERGDELGLGRRDQGRLEGRDAALEERLARATVARGVGRGEVDAGDPVHLQVDEPGNRDAAAGAAVEADGRDPPVLDLDVSLQEEPVDDGSLDAQSQGCVLTRPPAPRGSHRRTRPAACVLAARRRRSGGTRSRPWCPRRLP